MSTSDTAGVEVVLTVHGGNQMVDPVEESPALVGLETSRGWPEGANVGFCDWPFTEDDPDHRDHLRAVELAEPEIAVAPDVEGEWGLERVVEFGDRLLEHASTVVVVPKECEPGAIPERFRIGYPNQPNFGSNGSWFRAAYPPDRPVHVLGGSPDSQLELDDYFNVASVDGANVVRYAEYGRVWTPGGQLERPDLSYYDRVRESLGNIHAAWNMEFLKT